MHIPRIMAAAVLPLLVLGMTACGGNSNDPDAAVSWDKINQEYQQAAASFPFALPAEVSFPKDAPETDVSSLYEPGWGAMQAYLFAECAQEKVALDNQTSDPAKSQAALDMITQIDQSPVYTQHFQDPTGIWKGIVAKAKLGDYSQFSQEYANDCVSAWFQGKQS
jgi:hypothetical protein